MSLICQSVADGKTISRVGRMKKPLLMFSAKAESKKTRLGWAAGWGFLLSLTLLAGCQAFTGSDDSGTLAAEMTLFVTEAASIQQAAAIDQTRSVETLTAAGGTVAAVSVVNLALAATVKAGSTAPPAIRAVVVSAADMSSSLDMEMMDDSASDDGLAAMRVSDIAAARRVNRGNGCSSGSVTQFSSDDERIYVTARVAGLRNGTNFVVDWFYEERAVYRSSWQADYSAPFECIWFYAVADDFSFLPGGYTATLYVNGEAEPPTRFSIRADQP